MAGVAQHLEVTTAALYHYVDDVEELRQLAAGARLGDLGPVEDRPWPELIREGGEALRQGLLRLPHLPDAAPVSPQSVRWTAAYVDALTRAGLSGEAAVRTVHQLGTIVWMNVKDERLAQAAGGQHPQEPLFRSAVDQVEPDDAAAPTLAEYDRHDPWDADARFRFELDTLIRATQSRLDERPET